MFANPLTQQLTAFVESVGIKVQAATLPENTFLPGLDIEHGVLLVDEDKLKHHGDVLHEAGHIAVADAERRAQSRFKPTKGEEMAAIAWSYAAAHHLGIDPEIVLHSEGYQGGGDYLATAFADGTGPGVPLLGWMGLTVDPFHPEAEGKTTYPAMHRWVR